MYLWLVIVQNTILDIRYILRLGRVGLTQKVIPLILISADAMPLCDYPRSTELLLHASVPRETKEARRGPGTAQMHNEGIILSSPMRSRD